jgi:hypothetical protein
MKMLGRPDASAIPGRGNPGIPLPSAEVEYELTEGTRMRVHFKDEIVDAVRIFEPAGPPEMAAEVAGVWRVSNGRGLNKLELRQSGFMIRTELLDGRSKRTFGRWKVIAPGKLLFYTPEGKHVAGVYDYKITRDSMTLSWIDERTQLEGPFGVNSWRPWLADLDHPSMTLKYLWVPRSP